MIKIQLLAHCKQDAAYLYHPKGGDGALEGGCSNPKEYFWSILANRYRHSCCYPTACADSPIFVMFWMLRTWCMILHWMSSKTAGDNI